MVQNSGSDKVRIGKINLPRGMDIFNKRKSHMKNLMFDTAHELSEKEAGGHGDRWAVFEGGTQAVVQRLPTIIEKAIKLTTDTETKAKTEALITAGEPDGTLLLYSDSKPDSRMTGAMALIHIAPSSPGHKPANALWSAYPVFGEGAELHGMVERVRLYPNHLEGQLEIALSTGSTIFTFDSLFCLNRALYQEGETYQFSVSALAYSMESPGQREHVIDDPEEIRRFHARDAWAKVHGHWTKEDESASLAAWQPQTPEDRKPIHIDMSRMTILMPSSDSPSDNAGYMGKVTSVTPDAVRMLDTNFWRVDVVLILPDDDEENMPTAIPIYIAENLFEGKWRPSAGEYVTGGLWLQAYAKPA